jgi:hypothetical protein
MPDMMEFCIAKKKKKEALHVCTYYDRNALAWSNWHKASIAKNNIALTIVTTLHDYKVADLAYMIPPFKKYVKFSRISRLDLEVT